MTAQLGEARDATAHPVPTTANRFGNRLGTLRRTRGNKPVDKGSSILKLEGLSKRDRPGLSGSELPKGLS